MTLEEIRTRINERLQDGTGPARRAKDAHCMYRNEQGLRCAVGCLIPEEAYDPAAESFSVSQLYIVGGLWEATVPSAKPLANMLNLAGIPATEEVRDLLVLAQTRHDYETSWEGSQFVGRLV